MTEESKNLCNVPLKRCMFPPITHQMSLQRTCVSVASCWTCRHAAVSLRWSQQSM